MLIKSNLKMVERSYKQLTESLDEGVRNARDEMMAALIQLAKREIKGKRGKTNGKWDKAEAGKPPKNRTGNLRRSIRGQRGRSGFGVYTAIVGPTMVYGRAVELGGKYAPKSWRNSSAIKGFPYMEPAFIKFKQSGLMQEIIARNVMRR